MYVCMYVCIRAFVCVCVCVNIKFDKTKYSLVIIGDFNLVMLRRAPIFNIIYYIYKLEYKKNFSI